MQRLCHFSSYYYLPLVGNTKNDQCLHRCIAPLMPFTSYRQFDLSVVADCCHGESIGSSGLQSPQAGPAEDGGEQINVLIMSEAADSISLPSESLLLQCDSKSPCAVRATIPFPLILQAVQITEAAIYFCSDDDTLLRLWKGEKKKHIFDKGFSCLI